MKIFLKKWVNLLLVPICGLSGNPSGAIEPLRATPIQIAQSQSRVVPVVLPCLAKVLLKKGGSKTGRLTEVIASNKQLRLSQGQRSELISIAQIQNVEFSSCDTSVQASPNREKIRGEKRNWAGLPLQNLSVLNGTEGRAKVNLPPGIDAQISKDQGTVYIVEELSFPTNGKVNLGIVVTR